MRLSLAYEPEEGDLLEPFEEESARELKDGLIKDWQTFHQQEEYSSVCCFYWQGNGRSTTVSPFIH